MNHLSSCDEEVIVCLKKIPPKKSPVADGVTYKCNKKNISKFALILTIIFNACISLQRVSLSPELKHSIITLDSKCNGDVNNIEDLRQVSLILTCYKMFMKLVTSRHLPWVVDTHRLFPHQADSMNRSGLHEDMLKHKIC